MDHLSAMNRPEGPCPFCLVDMAPNDVTQYEPSSSMAAASMAAADDDGQFLRFPCFHAAHLPCFTEWWAWQQREWRARERCGNVEIIILAQCYSAYVLIILFGK